MFVDEKIFMARVAESSERYDDMVTFLTEVVKNKREDFTAEENASSNRGIQDARFR